MQTHISFAYAMTSQFSLKIRHHHYKNFNYQELRFIQLNSYNHIIWHLIPEVKAAGISYISPVFRIGISTDDLNSDEMKYLALYGQIYQNF